MGRKKEDEALWGLTVGAHEGKHHEITDGMSARDTRLFA